MNYNWNWGVFFQQTPDGDGAYWEWILAGFYWTLAISAAAWIIAMVLGRVPPALEWTNHTRAALAAALGLPADAVNVKATTGEGLGFIGRGEGAAAIATATIEQRG